MVAENKPISVSKVIFVSPILDPIDFKNCKSIEDLSSNEPKLSVSKDIKASAIVDLPLPFQQKSL